MYKKIIRPLLFSMPAETAHHFSFRAIKFLFNFPGVSDALRGLTKASGKELGRELFGLHFENPVGLAAGFDKDAKLIDELSCLGFGFIEIGTLTPKPQSGNLQPRLFRLPEDGGLINRMGFNNEGLKAAKARLARRKSKVIVGGNIGKNKVTPNEEALGDYLKGFEELFDLVDYFVVNVSSPNTPNLRDLQEKEPLTKLLQALQTENQKKASPKPILLKIAPDLTNTQLDDIVDIVRTTGIAGVIATNTTISREGLQTDAERIAEIGNGGLSGNPVRQRSTEVIKYLHDRSGGSFPIIGVGGIRTAADAIEKLEAGASLLQLYTGFIYEGPMAVKRINEGIREYLRQKGA